MRTTWLLCTAEFALFHFGDLAGVCGVYMVCFIGFFEIKSSYVAHLHFSL